MMGPNKQGYSIFYDTLADMTWMEIEQAALNDAILLVPIGSIEQHGPHLPTATDTYLAYILAILTKKKLEKENVPALIAPPFIFGITDATKTFPGSITMTSETLTNVLSEILTSYMNSGFKNQYLLNIHGEPDHIHAVLDAVTKANQNGVEAVFLAAGVNIHEKWNIPQLSYSYIGSEKSYQELKQHIEANIDIHAGELETSGIMKWFSETLKDRDNIAGYEPQVPTVDELKKQILDADWRTRFPLGYIGEPHRADPSKAIIFEFYARDAAKSILENRS